MRGFLLDVPARRAVVQHVHGYGALETGLAFLPMTLMMGGLSPGVAARLMKRVGPLVMRLAGLRTSPAQEDVDVLTVHGEVDVANPWEGSQEHL